MDPTSPERAYTGGNTILDRLSPGERESLLPQLNVSYDEEGSVLRARDAPLDAVHFPIDAVYSIVVELALGHTYEVGVIGRGGAVGAEIAIGAHVSSRTVLCQSAGSVAYVSSDRFRTALDRSPTFLASVRESLRRQWFDSQQTVACNFAHATEQRAARWILMTQDQIGRDRFHMRKEFLSIMLGIAPARVGEPMALLEQLGCIYYKDDQLTVRSREALLQYACECYETARNARFIITDRVP
jgi:CRP-like cAMP-binding protein